MTMSWSDHRIKQRKFTILYVVNISTNHHGPMVNDYISYAFLAFPQDNASCLNVRKIFTGQFSKQLNTLPEISI